MLTFREFLLERWEGRIQHSTKEGGFQYLKAYDKDKEIGHLEYKHHPKEKRLDVWMIHVHPDYQRKGVATSIMDAAKEKHPDSKIDWGTKTYDGLKFVRKYDPSSEKEQG